MIPIKIICECGQKYAFDVEPVNGRMNFPVACPVCGIDGTAAANAAIAKSIAPAAAPTASTPAVRIVTAQPPPPPTIKLSEQVHHSTAPKHSTAMAGQVDPAQAVAEAAAKISWGEPADETIHYLRVRGFSLEEASALVNGMVNKRLKAVRVKGTIKLVIGLVMMTVPVGGLIAFKIIGLSLGITGMIMLGLTAVVGVIGMWMAINGAYMIISPKSEKGDVAGD